MKRILGITALLVGLAVAGQAAAQPVQGPVSPPLAFGPFVPQGLTTTNAPGGASPTRPTFGYPTWPGTVAVYQGFTYYADPPTCCLAEYGHFAMPASRMGYGAVAVWVYDKRWPAGARWFDHPGAGYYAGSWEEDIPIRSPTLGYPQSGANDGTGHGIIFSIADMANYPEQSSLYQITYLQMDWYGQVKICSGANFTGVCHFYGFGCTSGGGNVCHGDSAGERANPTIWTDVDVHLVTADLNGVPFPHLSFQAGYGW